VNLLIEINELPINAANITFLDEPAILVVYPEIFTLFYL